MRTGSSPSDDRGRVTHGPVPLVDALGVVAGRLGLGPTDLVTTVFGHWEALVGPALAAHVRPLRLDGETLVVSVDHPAWATQVRHLAPEILERLDDACGGTGAPVRLDIRVRH